MYSNVPGAATIAGAAIVLPNTGENTSMTIIAGVTLAVGVAILASSIARMAVKNSHKG